MGLIPVIPVCSKSEWKTNSPSATSTIAVGKISQNNLKENSVTALVIGTGPVNVIVRFNSSHVQTPVSGSGTPSLLTSSQYLSCLLNSFSCAWVFAIKSFASTSSETATAIIALSSKPSGPPQSLSPVVQTSLASLSRPGVGEPSSSYISPSTKSIVGWLGIS